MDANRLLEIAQDLGFDDLKKDLQWLSNRMTQQNCPLILPLVGEFSAGKTTLLNALTDNKKLETSFKHTTATIFEVHFGCDKCHAIVFDENGEKREILNIEDLKNAELANSKVVEVFDTSKRVPSSTIIVDTPGLSSPDPKHKQTLVDFLPKADGILLVLDINQGLTKSTTDQEFLKTITLSKRPIYVVFTQCDLKSPLEIEKQKKYLLENTQIPIKEVVCVSGKKGDLDELYMLLEKIQKSKDEILEQVNKQRFKNTINVMINRIDDLLKSTNSDSNLEEAIREKKLELNKLNRNIDNLISSLEDDVEKYTKDTIRKFEDVIFNKLDNLVAGRSANFDAEAVSAINATMSLLFNEYKEKVKELLKSNAREKSHGNDAVSLRSLESIDVSSLTMQGAEYNLNLNNLGHEHDSLIAVATTTVAVIGAGVYGGAAAGAGGAFDALDTATDIIFDGGSMLKLPAAEDTETNPQNQKGGIITHLVGLVTDKTLGKPQRRRAIHDYMDGLLIPHFTSEINSKTRSIISAVSDSLHEEAAECINTMTFALEQLRTQMAAQKADYQKRINQLREYKNELTILS